MFQYIIKRILIFIPTFFIISLIIFGLSKMAPGDPVEVLLTGGTASGQSGQRADIQANELSYLQKAQELGLDKPAFYLKVSSAAFPKDLYKIRKKHHRELVARLINQYGNNKAVLDYYENIKALELEIADVPTEEALYESRLLLKKTVEELFLDYEDAGIRFKLDTILHTLNQHQTNALLAKVEQQTKELKSSYQYLTEHPTRNQLYIPTIYFYGSNNQYHTWMFGDYPWFSVVDSSVHHRVDKLYQEIASLTLHQDSLYRIIRPLESQSNRIDETLAANDSLKTLKIGIVDSLKALRTEINEEKDLLIEERAPLLVKIKALSSEKNKLSKELKIYASRGFLRGDFGKSYKDSMSVTQKISMALQWTLLMNFLAILLSYLISIPLGVQSALWKTNKEKKVPFLSLSNLIGAGILVTGIYLYLSHQIALWFFYSLVVSTNILFLLYHILTKKKKSKIPVGLLIGIMIWGALSSYLIFFDGLRLLNASLQTIALVIILVSPIAFFAKAKRTDYVLKLLYLWISTVALLLFLLQSWVFKLVLLSLPIAGWGLRKLTQRFKEKSNNFKVGLRGIYAKGSFIDNLSTTTLFILYSLPSFWIGTLLITFFTTNEYGELYNWFPTSGVQTLEIALDKEASTWTRYADIMYHMFLPVFCLTYGSFAYLSRQMRGAMLSVVRQDYIRTAKAKGLGPQEITWKHSFRNSLFPIITLFSSIFPRALSGSIAIELIFNIPGMGGLLLGAITERDWPVVFTIAMLASILTMIGNLIADILYAIADPRISYK